MQGLEDLTIAEIRFGKASIEGLKKVVTFLENASDEQLENLSQATVVVADRKTGKVQGQIQLSFVINPDQFVDVDAMRLQATNTIIEQTIDKG